MHVSTHENVVVLSNCVVHPGTKVVEAEHGAIGELVVLRGRGGSTVRVASKVRVAL